MITEKLGNLFRVRSGDGISIANLNSFGVYPVYGGNGISGYTSDYNVDKGTMIIGRVGEKCGNVNITDSKSWVSDNALIVTPKIQYDIGYLRYLLERVNLNDYANRNAQPVVSGQIIYAIEASYVEDLEIQRIIAYALQNFDTYIDDLAKLIEKKKGIRDGALADLVTGRTRINGFNGKWTQGTIGHCVNIYQGGTPSTSNPSYWNGNVKWVTPGEITRLNGLYISDSERKITEAGVRNSSAKVMPAGTILLCTRATIGELAIASEPMATNQGFKNLVCKLGMHNVFMAYLLMTMKSTMIEQATGTTFLEISKKKLAAIDVTIPPHDEQIAIASILTAMDAEIKSLEAERNKIIQIREGTMDELLTGRIRLKT